MVTRLSQLHPEHHESPNPSADVRINFICPGCFQGRVLVDLRLGEPKDAAHGANALPPAWDAITITPSIAAEGTCNHCPGWHGFVQGGLITPDPQPLRRDDEDPFEFARLKNKWRAIHDREMLLEQRQQLVGQLDGIIATVEGELPAGLKGESDNG